MILLPYSAEVEVSRWPVANLAIIGACTLMFVLIAAGVIPDALLGSLVLNGYTPSGLLGYQFLHAGLLHLLFNMIYLWVFGNAICQNVGSPAFGSLFLLFGVLAGILHNLMDGHPAVGASGAINGVIGFYLVLYPTNRINCFYWIFRYGTFQIAGYWLIVFYFAMDAWQAASGAQTGTAYWAHVGGFASGFLLGVLFLTTGLARMAEYDNPTLLDYLAGKPARDSARERSRSRRARLGAIPVPRGYRPPVTAPPEASEVSVDCPSCGQNLTIGAAMVGISFACPACGDEIRVDAER